MILSYTDFKTVVTAKGLSWQYISLSDRYYIFAEDSRSVYETNILFSTAVVAGANMTTEAANKTDFDTNYAPSANTRVERFGNQATSPAIPYGSGVMGWLQSIWAKLNQTGLGSSSPATTGASEAINLRAYTAVLESTVGAAEAAQILFRNPTGSGKKVYIRNISFCSVISSGKDGAIRVYSAPTFSAAGTTVSTTSMYIGGGATTPVALVTSAPTVSANGTKITVSGTADEESVIDYDWGLILAPGQSILVTFQGGGANTDISMTIIWSETN